MAKVLVGKREIDSDVILIGGTAVAGAGLIGYGIFSLISARKMKKKAQESVDDEEEYEKFKLL